MPSTVSSKPVASAPSLWAMLAGLGGRHRLKLALTYTLTLVENALDVLYPFLTGVAIDALLAGAWSGVAPLLIAWTVHLVVGLFRHVYDTRVFTLVYANLASDLIERQRAQGADAAHLAARVALSREIVDFLQVEVPAAAASVVRFIGAIAMLCVLNMWVGALAVLALLPVALFTTRFGRVSLRLNERPLGTRNWACGAGLRRRCAPPFRSSGAVLARAHFRRRGQGLGRHRGGADRPHARRPRPPRPGGEVRDGRRRLRSRRLRVELRPERRRAARPRP